MEQLTIKGIIFDLDGTLINSLEDLTDACNDVMRYYGYAEKTYEEGKKLIGNGIRMLIKRALPEDRATDDAFVDEATARMKAFYAKRYTNKTEPYAGIPAMIAALKTMNIPFGICTNKPHNAAQTIVEALFDKTDFVDVIGQREGKPRKPDPTQTLELAEKMNVLPENCIYAGDSLVDYETATNAGMIPLLCTWGFSKPEVLKKCEGAVCVDTPEAITDFIKAHLG